VGPGEIAAIAFAALFVGVWLAFGWALLVRPDLLDSAWGFVRSLPFFIRGLVWLAFLPWMIALAFWQGVLWPESWPRPTRYLAIAALAAGWTLVVVDGAIP